MQIKLNHVGLIKDSTIALDGLTVITGKNNSGKTTVGKTLYALLDAVSNLRTKARRDRSAYILTRLDVLKDYLTNGISFDGTLRPNDYPALDALLSGTVAEQFGQDLGEYLQMLRQELVQVDSDLLRQIGVDNILWISLDGSGSQMVDPERLRKDTLSSLDMLLEVWKKDPKLIDYARESINQSLRVEFSGQIQPVRTPDPVSTVELLGNGEAAPVYFRLSLINNGVVNDGRPVFFRMPFKRVYMIDDPFILDAPPVAVRPHRHNKKELETFFNPNRVQFHNRKLRQAVVNVRPVNVFEQTVLNDSLSSIKRQIDAILPGTFEFSSEGEYYVENGAKIQISNLATGSKMFSIIKLLLERGRLDSATMLILDEPEAHLHPAWQNAFAEIIVLLVKELKVNVVLTTHSPNFMLALDAHMRKHDIIDQTNFYQTRTLEGSFVQYHCVNDDLGQIYDDFLQYLSEMKMLREQYLCPYGEEEEEEESE